jgi:hypothetical protein
MFYFIVFVEFLLKSNLLLYFIFMVKLSNFTITICLNTSVINILKNWWSIKIKENNKVFDWLTFYVTLSAENDNLEK